MFACHHTTSAVGLFLSRLLSSRGHLGPCGGVWGHAKSWSRACVSHMSSWQVHGSFFVRWAPVLDLEFRMRRDRKSEKDVSHVMCSGKFCQLTGRYNYISWLFNIIHDLEYYTTCHNSIACNGSSSFVPPAPARKIESRCLGWWNSCEDGAVVDPSSSTGTYVVHPGCCTLYYRWSPFQFVRHNINQ